MLVAWRFLLFWPRHYRSVDIWLTDWETERKREMKGWAGRCKRNDHARIPHPCVCEGYGWREATGCRYISLVLLENLHVEQIWRPLFVNPADNLSILCFHLVSSKKQKEKKIKAVATSAASLSVPLFIRRSLVSFRFYTHFSLCYTDPSGKFRARNGANRLMLRPLWKVFLQQSCVELCRLFQPCWIFPFINLQTGIFQFRSFRLWDVSFHVDVKAKYPNFSRIEIRKYL